MAKRIRLLLVALLYALMFFYAGVNLYFQLAGVGSYDGWTAMGDGQGRAAGEILGFDKGADILRSAHRLTATQIVAQFIQAEDQWAQGFAQNDDVTFVVLKVK